MFYTYMYMCACTPRQIVLKSIHVNGTCIHDDGDQASITSFALRIFYTLLTENLLSLSHYTQNAYENEIFLSILSAYGN